MKKIRCFAPHPDAARSTIARFLSQIASAIALATLWISPVIAQKSAGPANGTLIVDGGGATEPIVRRFVELAGGPQARIVVIATAPSSIRFGDDNVILDPDWPRDRNEWGHITSI